MSAQDRFVQKLAVAVREVALASAEKTITIRKIKEKLKEDVQLLSMPNDVIVTALLGLGLTPAYRYRSLEERAVAGFVRDDKLAALVSRASGSLVRSADLAAPGIGLLDALRQACREADGPGVRLPFKEICERARRLHPDGAAISAQRLGRLARFEVGLTLELVGGKTWVRRNRAFFDFIGPRRQPVS